MGSSWILSALGCLGKVWRTWSLWVGLLWLRVAFSVQPHRYFIWVTTWTRTASTKRWRNSHNLWSCSYIGFPQHLWHLRNWALTLLQQLGLQTPAWVGCGPMEHPFPLFLFFCTERDILSWYALPLKRVLACCSVPDTFTAGCELACKKQCPVTLTTTSLACITQGLWYKTACAGKGFSEAGLGFSNLVHFPKRTCFQDWPLASFWEMSSEPWNILPYSSAYMWCAWELVPCWTSLVVPANSVIYRECLSLLWGAAVREAEKPRSVTQVPHASVTDFQ